VTIFKRAKDEDPGNYFEAIEIITDVIIPPGITGDTQAETLKKRQRLAFRMGLQGTAQE
jgi:hypothetical protein